MKNDPVSVSVRVRVSVSVLTKLNVSNSQALLNHVVGLSRSSFDFIYLIVWHFFSVSLDFFGVFLVYVCVDIFPTNLKN